MLWTENTVFLSETQESGSIKLHQFDSCGQYIRYMIVYVWFQPEGCKALLQCSYYSSRHVQNSLLSGTDVHFEMVQQCKWNSGEEELQCFWLVPVWVCTKSTMEWAF